MPKPYFTSIKSIHDILITVPYLDQVVQVQLRCVTLP